MQKAKKSEPNGFAFSVAELRFIESLHLPILKFMQQILHILEHITIIFRGYDGLAASHAA